MRRHGHLLNGGWIHSICVICRKVAGSGVVSARRMRATRVMWTIGLLLHALLAIAQNPTVTISLVNGDATRDNRVDDSDLVAVLFAAGSNNSEADLNGDGTVDDADLTIVLFSFGQTGATPLLGSRVYAYGTHFVDVQVHLTGQVPPTGHQVYIEAQRIDDVLVFQSVDWIQGAEGTVSLALPEAGVYQLQVYVQNGSWLRAEQQVQVGLQVRDLIARAGNGCAVLMWEELPDDSFSGYRVYRRSGSGEWVQVATLPPSAFLYADQGLTNGVRYEYKLAVLNLSGDVIHETAAVSVTPTASVGQLVWDSQSYIDDRLQVSVRMSSGSLPSGYAILLVDGAPWSSLGETADAPGKLLGFINRNDLPLGSHSLQAVVVTATNAFVTPTVSLNFGSDVGVLLVPSLMYLGGTARFQMELPTDVISWQLRVMQNDNQEVRAWSGNSSRIDVIWDGRDESGNDSDEGLYWVQVFASRANGMQVNAVRPLQRVPRISGPVDAVALLDGDVGDRRVVELVAQWISARLKLIQQRSGGALRYYVYLYTASMHGGRPAHRRFVADLVNWMSSTVSVFYGYGHGSEVSFSWGGYRFVARGGGNWPRGRIIDVSQLVGSRSYKFVFGDWCRSALTDDWANAFNADCFLGFTRLIPVWGIAGSNYDYALFTMYIWGDLAAGYRISQALNFTCGAAGRLRGRAPCLTYRWTCDPTIWFGRCPDISLP
ncbi:MAG: hypothetical protein KatS3mg016_2049 [Fimbriimonadales bacterium]|nr:MAG: hypothetical protein KatS3mg016_2049 [Fimbriimonadales bacterium]